MYVSARQNAAPARRAPRYAYNGAVKGKTASDRAFEAHVDNISASGVAITMTNPSVITDNGLFVSMHIEGLGQFKGDIARIYDDGFAVSFDETQMDMDKVRERLRNLDRHA